MNYRELEALPAETYLNPDKFITAFDSFTANVELRKKQYEQYKKGLEVGREAKAIHIAINSVWSADMKDGSYLSSYEGIGYHAGTCELLRGFLDSGCTIIVHRYVNGVFSNTQIK